MTTDAPKPLSFNELQTAAKDAAAFRCRTRLQADGGDGGKVFPPTYAGGVYAVENRRIDGRVVRCVLLDSVQSQANRMEEALLDAFLPNWRELPTDGQEPTCDLPVVAVHVENHGWVTSLTAPHRVHDAILRDSNLNSTRFRDSNLNSTRFRDSEMGQAIVNARLWNATAFYRYCPTALLFGTWDSTAGEGLDSAKVPRAVVSEIIGVDITPGVRTGGRLDPLGIKSQTVYYRKKQQDDWQFEEADGYTKGDPADINHGNVPPDLARFKPKKDAERKSLGRLPDILEAHPLKLKFDVETDDGRLESRTALEGETVRIRDGAVKPSGVTLPYALHTWTLSLTQLRRLRFPPDDKGKKKSEQQGKEQPRKPNDRDEAARTVLAALALYTLALLRERGYWLRSRCELISQTEGVDCPAVLELIKVDGNTVNFAVPDAKEARKLLNEACEAAKKPFAEPDKGESKNGTGSAVTQSLESVEHQPKTEVAGAENLPNPETTGAHATTSSTQEATNPERLPNPGWDQRVIRLTPTEKLSELVRRSDALTADTATEEQEAAGAGNPG